jgi:hypothetical protein
MRNRPPELTPTRTRASAPVFLDSEEGLRKAVELGSIKDPEMRHEETRTPEQYAELMLDAVERDVLHMVAEESTRQAARQRIARLVQDLDGWPADG